MTRRKFVNVLLLALILGGWPISAQQTAPPKVSNDPIDRIKDEGMNRSQVMQTLSYLTDVIGARLTGSPNLKRANEWTRDKLKGWGLENARLEAWGPFGRGWSLKSFSAEVIAPQAIPLIAFPKAWSNGTNGPLSAEIVYVEAKEEKDLEKYQGALKGKIVLSGPMREVKAHFDAEGRRKTEKDMLQLADAPDPTRVRPDESIALGPQFVEYVKTAIIDLHKLKFFLDEGAAAVLTSSRAGDGGTIFLEDAQVPREIKFTSPIETVLKLFLSPSSPWSKEALPNLPQITVSLEHFNRLIRMVQAGEKLRARIDLDVQFHTEDPMAYNTIAEIPGTDKKDEIVMVGAHMDSWHSGTGATDNGAGCAVAMEAVRILKALNLQPRRTIRIGLWSGEEQGLLGSRAYVKAHFGVRADEGSPQATMEVLLGGTSVPKVKPLPDYDKLSVYFNLDNGTGKIRGVYLQGNEAVRPVFREWLMPFKEMDASTLSLSNTGGTDHLSFDAIGLPGFQFIQDDIEYGTRSHHSNMDVFDRIQAGDIKQASTIMAAFLYNAAMLEQKLPRKTPTGK
jgi:carboxypeptidase Q